MHYLIVTLLVLLSGLFSGLTLGMFSLNLTSLERKIKLGNQDAAKIYRVRKNGNLLLCTLLLGNVAVNSTMAVFLGSIASGLLAGAVSTGLIVVFGEILPQAIFSRFALKLGARTWWLVRIFMVLFFPLAGPLAFLLDKMLGKELPTIWNKSEIKELIKFHEDSPHSPIDSDEEKIILGALSFSDKKAASIMTPRPVVYSLEAGRRVDKALLHEIKEQGFTRIPVYTATPDNVSTILNAKELIGLEEEPPKTVGELCSRKPVLTISREMKLDNLLNLFISRRVHIALVYDDFGVLQGLVTLEDVVEEVLKTEIMDETDTVEDLQSLAKQKFKKKLLD